MRVKATSTQHDNLVARISRKNLARVLDREYVVAREEIKILIAAPPSTVLSLQVGEVVFLEIPVAAKQTVAQPWRVLSFRPLVDRYSGTGHRAIARVFHDA